MSPVRQGLLMFAFIAAAGVVGKFDLVDEIEREAIAKQVRVERAIEDRTRMTNPLTCPEQWIAQRGAGEPWKVRCVQAAQR